MAAPASAPDEIRLSEEGAVLRLIFPDGTACPLDAEFLRVESPSAEVQGHGADRKWIGGKQSVKISGIEPVGNYAIRLIFDDGHDTGLYTWAYLAELSANKERLWARYLTEIAKRGLTRT